MQLCKCKTYSEDMQDQQNAPPAPAPAEQARQHLLLVV